MGLLRFLTFFSRIILWGIYLWMWLIPTRLTVLAIGVYFLLTYAIFGTVHASEIKYIFNKNETAYFFGFIIPFALPMFIAFISAFAQSKQLSGETSLQQAIKFRNGQMRVKPPVEASKILRKTSFLDALNSDDSDVYDKARRGYDAQYGNSSPTKVFKDLMDDDG